MGRKEEILAWIVEDIKMNGLRPNVTISSIAKELDMGKSTLYEYFPSKDQMFIDAGCLIIQSLFTELIGEQDLSSLSFEEAFKDFIGKFVALAKQGRNIHKLFANDLMVDLSENIKINLKDKVETFKKQVEQRFTKIFEKGIAENLFTSNFTALKEMTVYGFIMGVIIRYTTGEYEVDEKSFLDSIYNNTILLINN